MPASLFTSPHAWLLPYYSALRRSGRFLELTPHLRAQALADVVQKDYPAQAAEIRAWDPTTAETRMLWLDIATAETARPREVELWRMRKDERELRCLAVCLPSGVDLRLFEASNLQQTHLLRNATAAHLLSEAWVRRLRADGWL